MFLYIVIAVAVVLLALVRIVTWRSDHRGTRTEKFISQQITDSGVSQARAQSARNTLPGPTGGI